jgi:S-adenosyl-L-methionine hydrolase (adenosine-forming)
MGRRGVQAGGVRKPIDDVNIITLTTDFGVQDWFVGTMKGVILGIQPRAQLVDITHQISPGDIAAGAFALAAAFRYFPTGTVHLVVVDPGVGSPRRPLLVESAGEYFVAPDNGLLGLIYAREKHKVRAITSERFFHCPVSLTFHGRDIFAPVGAHLAKGVPPARFGKLISEYVRGDFEKPIHSGIRRWTGRILKIDRFGNLITNFTTADFGWPERESFVMRAGRRRVTTLAHSYSEGRAGQLLLIAGSAGYWEIATNQGSAAKLTGCAAGASTTLILGT